MFAWNKARRRVGWQECQIRQRFESRIPSVCTRDKSPSLHQHQYFVSRYSIAGTQRHPGENQFTMNNDIIHWRPTHRSWNELEQIYFWPARVNDRSRLFNLKQFPGLKECSLSLYKWYTNVSFSFFFFIAIPFFFFLIEITFSKLYLPWILNLTFFYGAQVLLSEFVGTIQVILFKGVAVRCSIIHLASGTGHPVSLSLSWDRLARESSFAGIASSMLARI